MNKLMKILIAYDGSEGANAMLADLHRAGLPRHAEVIVMSVAEHWVLFAAGFSGIEPAFVSEGLTSVKAARLLSQQAEIRLQAEFPEWQIKAKAAFGSPSEKIVEQAEVWQPDLLVLGSHGHSAIGRIFFGSVSHSAIHHAPCSVRIARGHYKEANLPTRILVGVDGSPGAEAAIRAVAQRAWPPGSEARVVSGYHLKEEFVEPLAYHENADAQLAEWMAASRDLAEKNAEAAATLLIHAGLQTAVVVKGENPKRLLLNEAETWDADSIFVGARGLSGVQRLLLGSVSQSVVTRAHCSVEVVRSHVKLGGENHAGT